MVGKRIEFFYLCIIWNYNEWDSLTRVLILFWCDWREQWQCQLQKLPLLFSSFSEKMGNKNHQSRQLRTLLLLSLAWYRSGDYDRLHYSGHAWCRFLRVLHSTHLENVLLAVLICALSGSSLRIMLVMIMALVSISNNFVLNHSNIDITQEFALQVQLQISSRPFWVSYITVTANSFSLFFMHNYKNVVPALMHV